MAEQDLSFDVPREAEGASVGAQLRQAREARGMSIESVAQAIKLTPRQVDAIETDAFDRLLSPTYARGFIRNYASLIGLDAQALLASLDLQHVRAMPQLVEQANVGVAMPMHSVRRKWLLPLIALSVPALAALVLYVWFEFWPAATFVPDAPVEEAPVVSEAAPVMPVPETHAEQAAPASDPSATLPAVVDQPSPVPPAEVMPGQKLLLFSFATDSWLEIRDGADAIILSELNRAGSSRTVAVLPPVSLVIGNARSVTMSVDGVAHDLAPAIKVDVARLRLE